jgi:hypothetical protein
MLLNVKSTSSTDGNSEYLPRDRQVSRIRPNGVRYGVDPARSDTGSPSFDVLTATTPNTYNVSGSASASITARASLMATPITVAATHHDRPTRPRSQAGIKPKRLNVYAELQRRLFIGVFSPIHGHPVPESSFVDAEFSGDLRDRT